MNAEEFYHKLWEDFVSLQKGDAHSIIVKLESRSLALEKAKWALDTIRFYDCGDCSVLASNTLNTIKNIESGEETSE